MRSKCGHLSAYVKHKRPLLFVRIAADNPRMEKKVINLIKQAIEELDISPEEASRRSGLERSYFRKLFERDTVPKVDTMRKISIGLGIPLEKLSVNTPSNANLPARQTDGTGSVKVPNRTDMPNDVPVMGTAAGSHLRGAFQMTSDPVDYVRRPPALMGAKDIYSLYVEGESMVPQFYPADLIFVHPHKPAKVGDPVVIQCQISGDSSIEATLGIYIKKTAENLYVRKHNPSAEIAIARSTVMFMHKVLTMNELFGV